MKNKIFLTITAIAILGTSALSFGMNIFDATIKGNLKEIDNLIKSGVSVNSTDEKGNTPLILACKSGNIKTVMALLGYKDIKVNQANKIGENPLIIACYNIETNEIGTQIAIELLNHDNIDVNYEFTCNANLINTTNEHTNIETLNKTFICPLSLACINGNIKIIKKLLKKGAIVRDYIVYEQIEKTKRSTISKYLQLARDYDAAESKRMEFLDNLWNEREAYKTRKSKTPNKYGLNDAYNILVYRSMFIKPLKTDPGYRDETKRTLFSGKTPEEMRKLHKFAEVGFTEEKKKK